MREDGRKGCSGDNYGRLSELRSMDRWYCGAVRSETQHGIAPPARHPPFPQADGAEIWSWSHRWAREGPPNKSEGFGDHEEERAHGCERGHGAPDSPGARQAVVRGLVPGARQAGVDV